MTKADDKKQAVEEDPGVVAAKAKAEGAEGGAEEFARAVELEAARIEAEEPAVSTEDATRRAKEKVGHPDPFNTVGGVDRPDEGPLTDAEAAKRSKSTKTEK